jgi:hypothetical protein
MKKLLRLLAFMSIPLLVSMQTNAQSIGIGSTSFTPDASSMLEIRGTGQGLLIPRMTWVNRPAAPVTGVLIYSTDGDGVSGPGFYYFNGTIWVKLFSGASGDYILNQTTLQNPGNFNISGNGYIASGVGIGTTSITAGYLLDVIGNIRVPSGNKLSFVNANWSIGKDINASFNIGEELQIIGYGGGAWGGASTQAFQIISQVGVSPFTDYLILHANLNNGRVGIGTSSPRGMFDVARDGDIYLASNTTTGTAQSFYIPGHIFVAPYNGTNISYIQARRSDNSGTTELQFRTYNAGVMSEAVRINGAGYVGIGTTAPAVQLHTTGGVRHQVLAGAGTRYVTADASGNLAATIDIGSIIDGAGTLNYVPKWTPDGNSLGNSLIYDNGTNVGITTTAPAYRLDLNSGTFGFGNANQRTETRDNAGLQGNAGAQSGFFETSSPTNYPAGASSWWHLIDTRHSNTGNNYAMQLSGSFFDQKLFFRKTNNNAAQVWSQVLTIPTGTNTGDNSGWVLHSNFAFSPDDISGATVLSGDDAYANYTMPFSVIIDGVSYNTITICTNGWISFGTVALTALTNTALPSSTFTNPTIFPYWDDLITNGNAIRYFATGTSPNRAVVVDFECATYSTAYNVRFQVTIHEGSGLINVQYRDEMNPNANGQGATIGFQLAGGAAAKSYPIIYNGKILDDNRDNDMGWSISPVR